MAEEMDNKQETAVKEPGKTILQFGTDLDTKDLPAMQTVDTTVVKENKPLDDSMLSDDEKKQVADFAEKIDLTNSQAILQYGFTEVYVEITNTSANAVRQAWQNFTPTLDEDEDED